MLMIVRSWENKTGALERKSSSGTWYTRPDALPSGSREGKDTSISSSLGWTEEYPPPAISGHWG